MPEEMAQSPTLRTEYVVSGTRTPPARRNSKLATLGRIFKPWKWRKKKNEKLKQTTALEKKISVKQSREELIKKGLLEIMEQEPEPKVCPADGSAMETHNDLPPPICQDLNPEDTQQENSAPLTASSFDENQVPEQNEEEAGNIDLLVVEDLKESNLTSVERTLQAILLSESVDTALLETNSMQIPSPPLLPLSQPKANAWVNQCVSDDEVEEITLKSPPHTIMKSSTPNGSSHISGHTDLFQPSTQKATKLHGQTAQGWHSSPSGSPHHSAIHMPLPPSRVIEELHRALATKHRQNSFQGREIKASPKKRVNFRTSRPSSVEKNKDNVTFQEGDAEGKCLSAKDSEENKENLIRDSGHKDDVLLYQDEEELNNSIISGTLTRRYKKELLTVKLRNRPSKQELEDRNIFPQRTDEERLEIRQQIEIKLSKRLSQRPAVEELERRNILKQRNDQTEQEERREIKQRLTRKLNQRPTVDELRERKILIRFSDYVEVAKAQDYDRRADKPWTRLSAADKAAIRKELNEYKSNEMQVHASSKHLTRYHRP
ncbi:phosphatase and actin regulator 3 isoform X2 [Xenopus laevis]|uniref:Phosphatase and actin regulator n=1 Tax=Xenopus laevis TaxID=8355 RepID=A0A8J0U0G5_XENLA|nr:phosphatase and actin regulator 3 isoform X2 [Xenopus laevis]